MMKALRWAACALALMAAGALQAQPRGGETVSFATRDARIANLELNGRLWPAAGATRGAVVLVHGSGGWSDDREGHHARALSAAGYAALAIDSFGPRGIVQTTEDQSQVSSTQMARDAFAARRFLVERGFAPERIVVMGFSKGGAAALFAADRSFLPREADRFAAAVAFYPGCSTRSRSPRPVGKVFMVLGEKDDYSGVEPCKSLAAAYGGAGGSIAVKVYEGASHGFDGSPARTGMTHLRFVENYMACDVTAEDDGTMSYAGKRYVPGDAALMNDMRKTCVKKGATIWTNLRQKEAATRDTIAFLDAALPKDAR
jgi:dienelactone hydrolase